MNYSGAFAKTVLALCAALLLLPAAASAYPLKGGSLAGGKTNFVLDGSLRRAMDAAGIKLLPIAPGKAKGAAIQLPITEGMMEPRYGSGYVYQGGGFKIQAGGRSVSVRRLILNTAKQKLTGVIAGRAMTVAKTDEVKGFRTDFGLAVKVGALRLSEKAATLISGRLGVNDIFRAHRSLGRATVAGVLGVVPITGGSIKFSLAPEFVQKLESLSVSVSVNGTGTTSGSPPYSFDFPEVQGELNRRFTHGAIGTTNDGLKFLQPASPAPKEVNWASLGILFENGFGGEGGDVVVGRWTGVSAVGPIGQIEFGSSPVFDPRKGEFTAPPTSATLSPYAAGPLNEAFAGGKEIFKAGEPLGAFSFVVGLR
ncbi:MAG TPA: hypothetical protein VI039_05620 [Solirubrobacterales bacterium]